MDHLPRHLLRLVLGVAALGATLSLASPIDARDEIKRSEASVAAGLEELGVLTRRIAEIRREQDDAWPSRAEDQENEEQPPLPFERLAREEEWLRFKVETVVKTLESATARDLDVLLPAVAGSDDVAFVEPLLPLLNPMARDDPRVVSTLCKVARKFDPCPRAVVRALVAADDRRGNECLFRLGLERRKPSLLCAAAESADPMVLAALIRVCEAGDPATATLGQRALSRLAPRDVPDQRVATLIVSHIDSSSSDATRIALINYLGKLMNVEHRGRLEELAAAGTSTSVRLAAIGALGSHGPQASEFLLATLDDPEVDDRIRGGCIHALGVARYRPAAPLLIELMREERWRRPAARALRRIARIDLGTKPGIWTRWWRAQPEATERDEESAVAAER